MVNVRSFRWEQALQLALKQQTHIATVLLERSKYLARMHKVETDPNFLQTSKDVQVDEEQVMQQVRADLAREGSRQ